MFIFFCGRFLCNLGIECQHRIRKLKFNKRYLLFWMGGFVSTEHVAILATLEQPQLDVLIIFKDFVYSVLKAVLGALCG